MFYVVIKSDGGFKTFLTEQRAIDLLNKLKSSGKNAEMYITEIGKNLVLPNKRVISNVDLYKELPKVFVPYNFKMKSLRVYYTKNEASEVYKLDPKNSCTRIICEGEYLEVDNLKLSFEELEKMMDGVNVKDRITGVCWEYDKFIVFGEKVMYIMSVFDNIKIASNIYDIFKDNIGNKFELLEESELFKNELRIEKNGISEVFGALVTKHEYLKSYNKNLGVLKDVVLSANNLNISSDRHHLRIEVDKTIKEHSEISMFYGKETTLGIIEIKGYFIVSFESDGLVQYFKFEHVNFEELIRDLSDIKY